MEESAGIEPAHARITDIHWFSGPAPYRSANSPLGEVEEGAGFEPTNVFTFTA